MSKNRVYCKCGCGNKIIPGFTTARKRREFINGHQNRGKFHALYKIENHIRKSCACGCGKLASGGKRFIWGHSNKGKHNPMFGIKMSGKNHWHYTLELHIEHSCLCGCGGIVIGNKNYLQGHSNKGKGNPRYKEELHVTRYCACGCGGVVNLRRRYIKGHHTRGKLNNRWGKSVSIKTGYGAGLYFIYKDKKIWLRSAYELIVAIYFVLCKLEINYEDRRVEYLGHTYLSDFRINNDIYEVKGRMNEKALLSRDAFISRGYNFKFIDEPKVKEIKELIFRSGFDINGLVRKVYKYHRDKKEFTFDSSCLNVESWDRTKENPSF